MARVEGLNKVLTVLRKLEQQAKKEDDVGAVVGYTAAYALFRA